MRKLAMSFYMLVENPNSKAAVVYLSTTYFFKYDLFHGHSNYACIRQLVRCHSLSNRYKTFKFSTYFMRVASYSGYYTLPPDDPMQYSGLAYGDYTDSVRRYQQPE